MIENADITADGTLLQASGRQVANGSLLRRSSLIGGAALAAGGGAAALALFAGPASSAVTLTVTTTDDGVAQASDCTTPVANSCSLRDALAAAADGDTITFSLPATSTITMDATQGQMVISAGVTITGSGRDDLTVDGLSATRVFYIPASVTSDVTISGLTITGGNSGGAAGGGLYSKGSGNITISNLGFFENQSAGFGGAFNFNHSADVVIDDVIANNNIAVNGAAGYVLATGTVDAANFVATNNGTYTGSTAFLKGAESVTVTGSVFESNTAYQGAGGLDVYGYSDNSVGAITITNSTFSDNVGLNGGLNVLGWNADVVIANSTASGNTATISGAGMKVRVGGSGTRSALIAQVTVSGNTLNPSGPASGAYYGGSGLILYGTAPMNNVSITGSIISGNAGTGFHDIDVNGYNTPQDLVITTDHSIIGTAGTLVPLTDGGGNTFNVTDPGLNALANNGGPTKTMSLKATSPAIDAGPNPVATFPGNQFDQRGSGFARISNGKADIGAFELQVATPVDPDAPVVPAFTG